MTPRRAVLAGLAGLLAEISRAQSDSTKVIFEHDLPNLTLDGWAVTAVEVSYGPGERSAAHRHPGITIAYVLEGEVRSKIADDPERTYKAGEMFVEAPEQLHSVSRNASETRPAKLLAILLAQKGKTLTTPA